MIFIKLENNNGAIHEMSVLATGIVREHFDPIIGKAQNDYMIALFQSEESIKEQLEKGYNYFFVNNGDENIGFLAFYPKDNSLYLSKFYLTKLERGKGYSHEMLEFIKQHAKRLNLDGIELNVNKNNPACLAYDKLGFEIIHSVKNPIGNGFFMDDYVYYLRL